MIKFLIEYNGDRIGKAQLNILPRIGEKLYINKNVYTVTDVVYDMDFLSANPYGSGIIVAMR